MLPTPAHAQYSGKSYTKRKNDEGINQPQKFQSSERFIRINHLREEHRNTFNLPIFVTAAE